MAAKNQQRNKIDFNWIYDRLLEGYASILDYPERNVIDELVFNLLLQGSTQHRALEAFQAMKDEFHDWNEVRVTIPSAIENCIKGVGLESVKSLRLVKILQGIFEDRSEVDLEFLNEMTPPAVSNYLGNMEGIGVSTVETVQTCALGEHIFPVTKSFLRFSQRFGLLDPTKEPDPVKKLKEIVESGINEGELAGFIILLDAHTESSCKSDKPDCQECVLLSKCKHGKKVTK